MQATLPVDISAPSRDLVRSLRTGIRQDTEGIMPESVAWHVYLELKRRGDGTAGPLLITALRHLHTRRSVASVDLPVEDPFTDEHREVEDAFLADLWRAYKKCIRGRRNGPAAQLLRDIEAIVV
ncbi:MAG: hypothetical protein EP330_29225 [Deltaproteobacteria bacterium]|nr:MAG: hypothetical protein EP330_29225 [Deltaproteobacteria bacterium]